MALLSYDPCRASRIIDIYPNVSSQHIMVLGILHLLITRVLGNQKSPLPEFSDNICHHLCILPHIQELPSQLLNLYSRHKLRLESGHKILPGHGLNGWGSQRVTNHLPPVSRSLPQTTSIKSNLRPLWEEARHLCRLNVCDPSPSHNRVFHLA